MKVFTTSQARANLFNLVDIASESHDVIYITGKRHNAVLISEEDYRSMQETIHIMSVPGLKESILKEAKKPSSEFSEDIDLED